MALDTLAPTARPLLRTEPAVLVAIAVLFLALRVVFYTRADLVGDEAYYWMWGQHLGLSYFDHPPLHAWLLRLVSLIGGWNILSARALTWVTLGGTLLIFADWSRRLAPDDAMLWFLRTAVVYLASPLCSVMTTLAFNDHLLVFLCLLAVHCFALFVDRLETNTPGACRWLYLASLALGLATLSKYSGALVGIGFACSFIARPRLRPLLKTPHPWLAGAMAVAMQSPVLIWNANNGFASFRYHLADRWGGHPGLSPMHPVIFLLGFIIFASPFLVWPFIRALRATPATAFENRVRSIVLPIFAASTVSFCVMAVLLDALPYWNIVAFVGVIPLLTRFLGNPWLRGGHVLYGLVVGGVLTFNFAIAPMTGGIFGSNPNVAINFGWSAIAAHVKAAEAARPVDMIGGTRFTTTAQLGFALNIADPVKLSSEHSQWDFWQADLPLAGKSALIIVDEGNGSAAVAWLQQHFDSLEVVDTFDVPSTDHPYYHWRLYRGEGLRP